MPERVWGVHVKPEGKGITREFRTFARLGDKRQLISNKSIRSTMKKLNNAGEIYDGKELGLLRFKVSFSRVRLSRFFPTKKIAPDASIYSHPDLERVDLGRRVLKTAFRQLIDADLGDHQIYIDMRSFSKTRFYAKYGLKFNGSETIQQVYDKIKRRKT